MNLSAITCIAAAFLLLTGDLSSIGAVTQVHRYILDDPNDDPGSLEPPVRLEQASSRESILNSDSKESDYSLMNNGSTWKEGNPVLGIQMALGIDMDKFVKSPLISGQNFIVMVVIWRRNTKLTSACHGTVISDRLVLIPSLCLGDLQKYPIQAIQVFHTVLFKPQTTKDLLSPSTLQSLIFSGNPKFMPKYEPLSIATKLCVTGQSTKSEKGHLSMIRLKNPLTSYKPVLLPNSKISTDAGTIQARPFVMTLNSTYPGFALVDVSECPKGTTDRTVTCFKRADIPLMEITRIWTDGDGLCSCK